MSKFKVGEDVMFSTYSRGSSRVPVEKVGRKYVYLQNRRFDIANGQGEHGTWIETLTEWDARIVRDQAVRALAAFGVDLRYGSPARRQAARILAVLRQVLDPTGS